MNGAGPARPLRTPEPAEPVVAAPLRSPVTEKMLVDWAGPNKFAEGLNLFRREGVTGLQYEHPEVRGITLAGGRTIKTALRLRADGSVESLCPCYENRERGVICAHVVALGLALRARLNDPELLRRREEEARRARASERAASGEFLQRAGPRDTDALDVRISLTLPDDWVSQLRRGSVGVGVRIGSHGHWYAPEELLKRPLRFGENDQILLDVLEDISVGVLPRELPAGVADFFNILALMQGRAFSHSPAPVSVRHHKLAVKLRAAWVADSGELSLSLLPVEAADAMRSWQMIAHKRMAWAYDGAGIRPVTPVLPEPLHSLYAGAVLLPRAAVWPFVKNEGPRLKELLPVESDVSEDLFTVEPVVPKYHLVVRGSQASLSATLYADYEGIRLIAGKQDPAGQFSIPDPQDMLRFTVRNLDHERMALLRLGRMGFSGAVGDQLEAVIGERKTMTVLSRHLPALRRAGWKVELFGRVASFLEEALFATPIVRIRPVGEHHNFEVEYSFEDARGASLTSTEIARAMAMGDSYVEKNGKYVLFDSGAVESLREVFEDCATADGSRPGSFRVSGLYASYVRDALHALDGVDIEADESWRKAAEQLSRGRPDDSFSVSLPSSFAHRLRPYQTEGVQWMRYLEQCGFAGILADEMGLGKTVQALAWLSLERLLPEARGEPALVVCPTSLVENWAEESARFAPELRVHAMSGADRHQHWDRLNEHDLVITSYALMRRDIERYETRTFSVVILDEAQHIKNRATQNALSAKRLKSHHRLVLTGTPMENGVSDLWSIMDFLMRGYLGSHEQFRRRYEQAIAAGEEPGEQAQARLRFKLRPFLLRRLKREVARELPPKVERIAWCTLSPDQQKIYMELLEHSRRRVTELVRERGFDASRMEILRLLLRLRQTCCHLDLLRIEGLQAEQPSAKMELLLELLQEALDGGHRVLLFSQFVSMLTVLRRALESRGWRYCYLDGATQNRMDEVRRFNTDRTLPIFLISLKAGGTGLNLTGADMVIHYDPWWNPAVEDQATDRAYRIGQQRMVYSVKLLARNTVEERVLAMQQRKQKLINATVEAGGEPLHRMSWEDVKSLLDL